MSFENICIFQRRTILKKDKNKFQFSMKRENYKIEMERFSVSSDG